MERLPNSACVLLLHQHLPWIQLNDQAKHTIRIQPRGLIIFAIAFQYRTHIRLYSSIINAVSFQNLGKKNTDLQ